MLIRTYSYCTSTSPPGRRVAGGAAHRMHDAAPPRGAREDPRIARSRPSRASPETQIAPSAPEGACTRPGRRRWRRPARSAARGPRPRTRYGSRRAGCGGRGRPTGRVPAGRRPTRPATGISSVPARGAARAHGPRRARVPPDGVLGGAAAGARPRDPEVDGADAGDGPALAAAVAPVAALARPVGPGAHGLVDGRLGHRPYGPGHVHHAVVESRHRGAAARDLVYLAHMRLSPFHGSWLRRLRFQAITASCFLRSGERPPTPTFGARSRPSPHRPCLHQHFRRDPSILSSTLSTRRQYSAWYITFYLPGGYQDLTIK